MQAMRLVKQGKNEPFEIFEKSDADPGPNQVAIRVHAAGLNPADGRVRRNGA